MAWSAQSTKLCVMASLFVCTFGLSLVPIKLMKMMQRASDAQQSKYKNVLSILSCYAAGVFFATCLLDLFPSVEDKMGKALDSAGIYTTYPIPEFLMAFGLFLLLVVEQMVLLLKEKRKPRSRSEERKPLLDSGSSTSTPRSVHQAGINGGSGSYSAEYDVSISTGSSRHERGVDIPPVVIEQAEGHEGHSHDTEVYQDPSAHSVLRSIILLLALSLHSVFEGLAVGLQPTTDAVLQIFAALILHKSILAFSLGLNLVQSRMKLGAIIRGNLVFSVTSPLGIGIGIAIDHFSPYSFATNLINGTLMGLACGTFVYVVFFEILPHEFNIPGPHQNRLLKVLFLILGFATISILLLFIPDEVVPKHVGS